MRGRQAPSPAAEAAPAAPAAPAATVNWGRIGLFYGIAFGGMCLVGLGLFLTGTSLAGTSASLVAQLAIAVFGMPLPLVAGLVTERVAGRRPLLRDEWRALRAGLGRTLAVALGTSVAAAVFAMGLTYLLGNLAGLPVGRFGSVAEVEAHMSALAGMPATLPASPLVFAVLAVLTGLVAGCTLNGLLAFGEEYGWRGVLADELAPLGPTRAGLLTGVLWGVWHAPLILLGFNYGSHGGTVAWLGILVMIAWVTPMGFVLSHARRRTGTIAAPAIIHGAFNGTAGVFMILLVARDPLFSPPVGLVEALAMTLLALAMPFLFPLANSGVARRDLAV